MPVTQQPSTLSREPSRHKFCNRLMWKLQISLQTEYWVFHTGSADYLLARWHSQAVNHLLAPNWDEWHPGLWVWFCKTSSRLPYHLAKLERASALLGFAADKLNFEHGNIFVGFGVNMENWFLMSSKKYSLVLLIWWKLLRGGFLWWESGFWNGVIIIAWCDHGGRRSKGVYTWCGFLGKKMSGCVGITLLTNYKTIVDHTLPNSGCVGNGNCSAANHTKL